LYILFLLLLTISCNSDKRKLRHLIKTWHGKEIIFTKDFETKISGRDTTFDLDNSKYKILNYIDTNGCTACRLKLYEWKLLKDEIDSLRLNVEFLFIAYQEDYDELEVLIQENKVKIPCIYDRNDSINKLNRFPTFLMFQTFLLDSTNHVVLIGNPTYNEKLWDLYKKNITQ
ncbi:MAG: hypothetical protein K2L23_05000, partial [Odoribacter sp.]|nr:hypothetical protein [Odoribacter sp.]